LRRDLRALLNRDLTADEIATGFDFEPLLGANVLPNSKKHVTSQAKARPKIAGWSHLGKAKGCFLL